MIISLSRQESVIFWPVREGFSPKDPLLGRPEGCLTSPSGRRYNSGMGQGAGFVVQSESSARTEKTKSFYDDVMQGVFSIFFSFLRLPSL